MRLRRSSSFYRSELARIIEQFAPGDYVVPTFDNTDSSLMGVVTQVNPQENKVYVSWNGGAIMQHDPEEVMLSIKHVDLDQDMGERMQVTVENDVDKNADPATITAGRRKIANDDVRSAVDSIIARSRESGEEVVDGGFSILRDLVRKEQAKETVKTALYHKMRGRFFRKNRFEKSNGVILCPRCKPDMVEMEKKTFERGNPIWVCPQCDWKISKDKIID